MATVYDLAEYILRARGPMSAMKLQKLVYYSQAWSLVWDERPLFENEIEAWANGPVVRALYDCHRGKFSVFPGFFPGSPEALTISEQSTVDMVLGFYGDKDPQWLSDLTHLEQPWRVAREGIPDGERGSRIIGKDVLAEYYGSL
jgi:uncharacterized phage-associated protein